MMDLLKKHGLAFLILCFSTSALAGGDDDFDFNPAPLASSIEGTWVTENPEFERPIVFKFCRTKSGRVQVSRANSSLPGSTLQYIYTMHAGPESHSVNRFVCDRQFGGYAKLKISTYFREGKSGEVVLGMKVFNSDIFDPQVLMSSVMRKVDMGGRPNHCDNYEDMGDSINHQGAPCATALEH